MRLKPLFGCIQLLFRACVHLHDLARIWRLEAFQLLLGLEVLNMVDAERKAPVGVILWRTFLQLVCFGLVFTWCQNSELNIVVDLPMPQVLVGPHQVQVFLELNGIAVNFEVLVLATCLFLAILARCLVTACLPDHNRVFKLIANYISWHHGDNRRLVERDWAQLNRDAKLQLSEVMKWVCAVKMDHSTSANMI